MDRSDSTLESAISASNHPQRQLHKLSSLVLEEEEPDSRCNWDIEIIQFLVESFIHMFPEGDRRRCGPPTDRRGGGTYNIHYDSFCSSEVDEPEKWQCLG